MTKDEGRGDKETKRRGIGKLEIQLTKDEGRDDKETKRRRDEVTRYREVINMIDEG